MQHYLFKAQWRGTALSFWVEARDEEAAQKKAERQVMRMLGGSSCMDLHLLEVKA